MRPLPRPTAPLDARAVLSVCPALYGACLTIDPRGEMCLNPRHAGAHRFPVEDVPPVAHPPAPSAPNLKLVRPGAVERMRATRWRDV
jgi:hypothetical protein